MTSLNNLSGATQKLNDLNITKEEVDKISEALKKPEFRKLLAEYAEEISNPENRKKYEEDIAAMEREQGRDVHFIHPTAAWVLKSVDKTTKMKVFVNIASNDYLGKPAGVRSTNGAATGFNWNIPHSMAPPRDDVDKGGIKCQVVDVVFHPDTVRMAESNQKFRDMVNSIALDAVCKSFKFDLDKENFKSPKNMKYKGRPQAAMVRKSAENGSASENASAKPEKKNLVESKVKSIVQEVKQQERTKKQTNKLGLVEENILANEAEPSKPTKKQPEYSVVYSKNADIQDFVVDRSIAENPNRPHQIRVTVELPGIESASELQLDVFERSLHLENDQLLLDLPLSYPVDEANSSAKFDKKRHALCITMPVLPEQAQISNEANDGSINSVTSSEVAPKPLIVELDSNKQVAQEKESLSSQENSGKASSTSSTSAAADEDLATKLTTSTPTSKSSGVSSSNHVKFESELVKCYPDLVKSAETHSCIELIMCGRVIDFDSVESTIADDGNTLTVKFSSRGQGGFPIFYQLLMRAPETILSSSDQKQSIRIFAAQAVFPERDVAVGGRLRVVVMKEKPQIWNECLSGVDETSLKPLPLELDDSIAPLALEGNPMRILSVTSCSSPDAPCRLASIADVVDSDDDFNIDAVESASSPRRLLSPRQVTFDVGADGDNNENDEGVFIYSSHSSDGLDDYLKLDDDDLDCEDAIDKATIVFSSSPDPNLPSILKSASSIENICDDTSQTGSIGRRRKSVSFSDKVDNVPFHKSEPAAAIFRALKNRRRRERRRSACSTSPREAPPSPENQNNPQGARRSNRRRTLSAGSVGTSTGSSGSCSPSDDLSLSFNLSNSDNLDVPLDNSSPMIPPFQHKQQQPSEQKSTAATTTKSSVDSQPSSADKNKTVDIKKEEPSFRPETVLSWGSNNKPAAPASAESSSRHCPFELSNSLMYELDASG